MTKKSALKKNKDGKEILNIIEQIRINLKLEDIEKARASYQKVQEKYITLDPKLRGKIYPTIKLALYAIDKKDINNLVSEYKKAKNNFQKKQAITLYNQINNIYKRLNKKDQAVVLEGIK